MTTFLIIAAIVCVITAAANLAFASQARRIARNYAEKLTDIEQQEKGLQKRHNALDNWEHQIKAQVNLLKKQQHVYATVAVDDPDDTAPDFPDTVPFKKMKSQMGYYVVPKFRDHIIRSHKDGKTIYTLDLYVAPYNEQHGNA